MDYHACAPLGTQDARCIGLGGPGSSQCVSYVFEHPPAGCCPVLQPGSPGMADVRAYGSLSSRMEADAKLLSGSKRSCEGDTSLQDEAEADDASMASHMMCRSGSVRSFGIKRVCSIASADGIDSNCMPQQGSIMIPVPGSSNSLAAAGSGTSFGGAGAAPAAAPAKRSSKTGSSISSQEHNGQALAAAPAAGGQEAASADVVCSAGRKLAPIKTSATPRGPRMRLNGRLLSPEEAQKHLQAVAAAAAAASAGRSLSRAQSPAVTCPGGMTSPAGTRSSSMSLSTGAPCNSAGHSSGTSGPAACKPSAHMRDTAATAGTAAPMRSSRVLSALDVMPENFIPTPEGVDTWHTLASTLEDGCGATSRGCSSPLVCSSYTELLLAEEADLALPPAAGARMQGSASFSASFTARTGAGSGLPPAAGPRRVSAFAGHSTEPWPLQQQSAGAGPSVLASAGSANQAAAGFASLSSSCPVHIPMHSSSSSGWTSSKLLGGSVSGSNGSSGNNPLTSSLAPQGSSAATDAQLSGLLDAWGAPQQPSTRGAPQSMQGVVAFTAGPSNTTAPAASSAAAAPAWKPAFSPGSSSAAAPDSSSGMVPTPGMRAAASTPALPALLQQQTQQPLAQLSRTKSAASRPKKHSKAAAAKGASKPSLQQQSASASASQQQQQMLMVANAGEPVVLSQQELMAVLQQNMAASFASGYMMATSNMNGQGGQQVPPQLQPPQPPLLKPVASIGAFVMPPAAVAGTAAGAGAAPAPWGASTPAGGPSAGGAPAGNAAGAATTAAAAAALGSSSDMARLVGGHAVDDILPSLQELLTDCY